MDKLIELQMDFVNERLGTFIHWNSAAAQFHDSKDIIDWEYGVENGGDARQYPFNEADWNPRHLDCKQWAKIAKSAGCPCSAAAEGSDAAFLYNWDGSGQEGDDLYFNVSLNGQTYTFTVESYLCDSSTEVYSAVKNLKVGEVIDMEGFLYWYNGVNPHITSVKVVG